MAFERNDIVNKTRLMGELGEELMGYEHNDIVTVDVMNKAIEEGGGGGDFSTATVTVIGHDGTEGFYFGFLPVLAGDEIGTYSQYCEGNTQTYTIALYKGAAKIFILGNIMDSTGDISVLDDGGAATGNAIVTGDCSITIRASD